MFSEYVVCNGRDALEIPLMVALFSGRLISKMVGCALFFILSIGL